MPSLRKHFKKAIGTHELPTEKPLYTDTIIAGPREVHSLGHVARAMIAARAIAPKQFGVEGAPGSRPLRIISGTAQGVDRTGERWAGLAGVPVRKFPASWSMAPLEPESIGDPSNRETREAQLGRITLREKGRSNNSAGPLRNNRMANEAHALVAIMDSREDSGTSAMVQSAKEKGIPILIRHIGSHADTADPPFIKHEYIDSSGKSTFFGEISPEMDNNIRDAFSSPARGGPPETWTFSRVGSRYHPAGFSLGPQHMDLLRSVYEQTKNRPGMKYFATNPSAYDFGPDFEGYRHGRDYDESSDRGVFSGYEKIPTQGGLTDAHLFDDHDPHFALMHRVAVQHVLNGGTFFDPSSSNTAFDDSLKAKLKAAILSGENWQFGEPDVSGWETLKTAAPGFDAMTGAQFQLHAHQTVDRNNPQTPRIQHVTGDLLDKSSLFSANKKYDVIVNTCNTYGTLGKGLADAFSKTYQDTDYEREYIKKCYNGETPIRQSQDPAGFADQQKRLAPYRESLAGTVWLHQPRTRDGVAVGPIIASAFVKNHYLNATRRVWLDGVVDDLLQKINTHPDLSSASLNVAGNVVNSGVRIGMPIMGGTNGMVGAVYPDSPLVNSENWPITQQKIEQVFGSSPHSVDIIRPAGDVKDYWQTRSTEEDVRRWSGQDWATLFASKRYAGGNKHSSFVKDLEKDGRTPAEINYIHQKIREHHLSTAISQYSNILGKNLSINPTDASTIIIPPQLETRLKSLERGFTRLLVGDNGIYVEFDPGDQLGAKGTKVADRSQYVEYARPIIGTTMMSKIYAQTKKVNYANYIPGMCYCRLDDYLGRLRHSSVAATPPITQGRMNI